jgi:uncharacterized protein (TIGR03437 family)
LGDGPLLVSVPGGGQTLFYQQGRARVLNGAARNAASFNAGITRTGIVALFGAGLTGGTTEITRDELLTRLAGTQVLVNGTPAQIFYASDTQINFLVPESLPAGPVQIVVRNPFGDSEAITTVAESIQPGIFFEFASGYGAIQVSGSGQPTQLRPARRGEFVEIYLTGLGELNRESPRKTTQQPTVTIGGVNAEINYSGEAPGYAGLYTVVVKVPEAAPAGQQLVKVTLAGKESNVVRMEVR